MAWILKDLGNGVYMAYQDSTNESFVGTKKEVDARIAAGASGTINVFAEDEFGNRLLTEDFTSAE